MGGVVSINRDDIALARMIRQSRSIVVRAYLRPSADKDEVAEFESFAALEHTIGARILSSGQTRESGKLKEYYAVFVMAAVSINQAKVAIERLKHEERVIAVRPAKPRELAKIEKDLSLT